MTALAAGAPSTFTWDWSQVNWPDARARVYRLQKRIAKAVREDRWGKVRALQHLLTHSFSAKVLAVKQVTSNKGKRTPGVDGVLWRGPRQFALAASRLKSRGYRAQPLRRIYIPKRNGKKRPLGIPTMHDRAMQALYALALKPIAETRADKHSYGFREKRSLHDAVKQCFIALATRVAAPWVLDADIKACFDRISHTWLLEHIPLPKRILRQWLKSGYMEDRQHFDTEEGTPQGGIISPILANMALDGLEAAVLSGRDKKRCKLNVVRYADDFIITAATQELLRDEVLPKVRSFLHARGLSLSEEKTTIRPIDQGFDFLGFHLRKFNGKLITRPCADKVKSFLQELKCFIDKARGWPVALMLMKLNSKLRGWAFANRRVVAKKLFALIDQKVFAWVCRWLKRQHPNRTWAWVKQRYRRHVGGRHEFGVWVRTKRKDQQWCGVFRMADVPIRRQNKIRAEADPYNPAYSDYFRQRQERQRRERNADRLFLTKTPLQRAFVSV